MLCRAQARLDHLALFYLYIERWRKRDKLTMVAVNDGFEYLFSYDLPNMRDLRNRLTFKPSAPLNKAGFSIR